MSVVAAERNRSQGCGGVFVRAPAKLNLFLELVARRGDGYHEIDTVMMPIAWYDQLRVRVIDRPEIQLRVIALPSLAVSSRRLGIEQSRLSIPEDHRNLVHRGLTRFRECFNIERGFECELQKGIPSGAGMGGASSDAAAALLAAAQLCDISPHDPRLAEMAATLGSDVPFFLGHQGRRIAAARATGRGERLTPISLGCPLHFVVVFPNQSLSTATVYGASRVPDSVCSSSGLISAIERGNRRLIASGLLNRLSEPAREIAPRIDEILKSMWRAGLRTCQLTGSGSACFAITETARVAERAATRLRAALQPGAIVLATHATGVPPLVKITSRGNVS